MIASFLIISGLYIAPILVYVNFLCWFVKDKVLPNFLHLLEELKEKSQQPPVTLPASLALVQNWLGVSTSPVQILARFDFWETFNAILCNANVCIEQPLH